MGIGDTTGSAQTKRVEANFDKKASAEPCESSERLLKGAIPLHDPTSIVEDEGYLYTFVTGRGFWVTYLPPGDDECLVGNRISRTGWWCCSEVVSYPQLRPAIVLFFSELSI